MSHCTSFKMEFADKRILYRAMRNLNLKPENKIWAEYRSQFRKKLHFDGKIIGKLLTGVFEDINIFFTELDNKLIPNFESSRLSGESLIGKSEYLLDEIRKEYVKCAVNDFSDKLARSGTSAQVQSETVGDLTSYIINIGSPDKKLSVTLSSDGGIEEKVAGINGQACLNVSRILENQLCSSEQLNRILTQEYELTIEDQVLQVFRVIE